LSLRFFAAIFAFFAVSFFTAEIGEKARRVAELGQLIQNAKCKVKMQIEQKTMGTGC
jgi:hypothetical protein